MRSHHLNNNVWILLNAQNLILLQKLKSNVWTFFNTETSLIFLHQLKSNVCTLSNIDTSVILSHPFKFIYNCLYGLNIAFKTIFLNAISS